MSEDARNGTGATANGIGLAAPSIFRRRTVATWLVIGALLIFIVLCFGLLFENVSPVSEFWFRPSIQADSDTYWALSGMKTALSLAQTPAEGGTPAPELSGNTLGPITQAKLFRDDYGVFACNVALLVFMLWIVGTMKEFDRSTFTLLLLLNPMLFSVVATLNKEIFAATGVVVFVRYMTAKRFRGLLLILALVISFAARWQQTAVMIVLACLESRVSPLRKKPWAGTILVLLMFTVAYTAVFHAAPVLIAALLAQAETGHTIVILDNIQANFGFPLVVVPKILFNVMGRFVTPLYYLTDYWSGSFGNWFDQIFTMAQSLLTTVLLFGLFFSKKLRLKDAPVYLLTLYLMMTAVNPMVQPRYEYPAYILLCLQASRFFRLGSRRADAPNDAATSLGKQAAPLLN